MKDRFDRTKSLYYNQDIVGAEIGTFKGENARSLIKELKPKKIYLIDPYETYNEYEEEELINVRREAEKRINKIKTNTEIVWIKKTSEDGLKEIKELLDFIYIDGNHTYPYVIKDLEMSWNKLKDGGVLCGHDFGLPDVAKAVLEFRDKHKLMMPSINLRDGDWIFIKEKGR